MSYTWFNIFMIKLFINPGGSALKNLLKRCIEVLLRHCIVKMTTTDFKIRVT